jgi:membrane protein implicated in regulation of membrane protease activity
MDKIQFIYLLFLGIGGLGLLSSLILGEFGHGDLGGHDLSHDLSDHGDAGDADSPKLFSLRIIFAFLMAFGIGGGAMYLSGKSVGGQVIVGFLSGIATATITYYIMKLLYSQQGNSNVNSESFIGKFASITVETTNSGSCQIKVDSGGGDQLFLAKEKNGNLVKQHESVKIVGRIGNTLIIEKISNQ